MNNYSSLRPYVSDFTALARLDLPTSTDDIIQAHIDQSQGGSQTPWRLLRNIIHIGTTSIQLISQMWVLLVLLGRQPESTWLVVGSFATPALQYVQKHYTVVCKCSSLTSCRISKSSLSAYSLRCFRGSRIRSL